MTNQHAKPVEATVNQRLEREPTLEEMLEGFDPGRHGSEAMPSKPVGREAL